MFSLLFMNCQNNSSATRSLNFEKTEDTSIQSQGDISSAIDIPFAEQNSVESGAALDLPNSKNDVEEDAIPKKVDASAGSEKPENRGKSKSGILMEDPQDTALIDAPETYEKIVESIDDLEKSTTIESNIDHSQFDKLLGQFVTANGIVDYTGLKKEEARLNKYLEYLSNNEPQDSWSKKQMLAYWINVYNANTLKLILKNWPVNSITDLHNGKPWDVKWIEIGDKKLSLNNVEHDIIRKDFTEPRIHFAVNCAAKSCPPLNNKAWTAANLEIELDRVTRTFIGNDRMNKISKNSLELSKIFEWYRDDFNGLINFINGYTEVDINEGAKISFINYDWSLNGV